MCIIFYLLPCFGEENFFQIYYEGIVSVNSSDPACKDGNARFTTTALKLLSDHNFENSVIFSKMKNVKI